ncbi:LysR family transcriptional regulator [Oceanomicrobium pacificus]|uniref:LysR family transcriptional regulator n=1 Tax=Oceanomicrobium pacificus TaxID=2692916 RepID=A0A6B0TJE9_9RHOB|nr:LysR family transcriptional regulator [Oceanomicrobium pacificus]MXU64580.1 LysR family transcriptional regulator [Oceanomicrobium pacificus]
MDRLSEMEAFVSVVDQGGFTEAARRLGMSKSAVSKHVASLEDRLGARLLNRTTRRVSPTEIGLIYYDRAMSVLNHAQEADDVVTALQEAPRGTLRLSAPVSFGTSHIAPLVGQFLLDHPEMKINMELSDKFVDLVDEGFDLAIRIGSLPDSSLRARKLGEAGGLLVAAPSYIEKHGAPERIEDLASHTLLHYSNMSTGNFWRLTSPTGEERQVRVGGPLTANNGTALRIAAEAGLGIAMQPSFILGDALQTGKLVQVLPDLANPLISIYAVYPAGQFVQPKLRVFIDHLAAAFKGRTPCDWFMPI